MNDLNLKKELNGLNLTLISVFTFLTILSSGIVLYLNSIYQTRLSHSFTLASKHSFIIHDLRQAALSLNPSLKDSFLAIRVKDINDNIIMNLPNDSSVAGIQKQFLISHVDQKIYLDSTNSNYHYDFILEFYFSNFFPLTLVLFIDFLLFLVFIFSFGFFKKQLIEKYSLSLKQKELETTQLIAKQVSHDIRSPLTALNAALLGLKDISEDQRVFLRSAATRINDIANQLLQKSNEKTAQNIQSKQDPTISQQEELSVELLPSIVDLLVTEKRIQYREKCNITIEADLEESYGAFAKINSIEYKRVLSNLINNSVEALKRDEGLIVVKVRNYSSKTLVSVRDNGSGIPEHILNKLGQLGVTHGKEGTESGSGLGVYHAKKTILSFGGTFEITSREDMGTEIRMEFPKCDAPSWFVPELQIEQGKTVIALDDDSSILEIWKQRFKNLNINLITLTSENDFLDLEQQQKGNWEQALFLIDFELLEQKHTGLDLVEKLNLSNAVLVTSRYDEPHIRRRCEIMKIKQIPKAMASLIPIDYVPELFAH